MQSPVRCKTKYLYKIMKKEITLEYNRTVTIHRDSAKSLSQDVLIPFCLI